MTNPAPRSVVSEAEIEELRKLAEAATQGDWQALDAASGRGMDWYVGIPSGDGYLSVASISRHPQHGLERAGANAAFIAALNPATVLRLLADREAAEEALARFGEMHQATVDAVVGIQDARLAAEERLREAEALLRLPILSANQGDLILMTLGEEALWAASRDAFLKPSKAKETAT